MKNEIFKNMHCHFSQGRILISLFSLLMSGHSPEGYRNRSYQHVILNLAKKDSSCLPLTRLTRESVLNEYYDQQTAGSIVGGSTSEHSYSEAQTFITGSSQARYMTWDSSRAVDYLLTREEVYPARIGITGMSGGGVPNGLYCCI